MASTSLVDRATASTLMAPDVGVNFAIVDEANGSPTKAQAIAGELLGKLSAANPKVAHLAVIVTDTLAKNGNAAVHEALAEVGVGGVLAGLSTKHAGASVGKLAAALLQLLGVAYAAAPGPPMSTLASAYASAKRAGTAFPFVDDSLVPADVRPLALSAPAAAAAPAGGDPQDRLLGQLDTVRGWIGECARLLAEQAGSAAALAGDAAFLDVLDRLEQCPDRLLRLIEAGMEGRLSDACLGSALEVQSALGELLPWAKGETRVSAEQATALLAMGSPTSPSAGGGAAEPAGAAGGAAGAASTETDDLGAIFGMAAPAAPAAAAATAGTAPTGGAATTESAPTVGAATAGSAPTVGAAAPSAAPAASPASFDDFDPRGGGLAPQTSHDSAFDSPQAAAEGVPPVSREDSFNPRAGEPVTAVDSLSAGEGAAAAPAPGTSNEDLADFEAFLDAQDASK